MAFEITPTPTTVNRNTKRLGRRRRRALSSCSTSSISSSSMSSLSCDSDDEDHHHCDDDDNHEEWSSAAVEMSSSEHVKRHSVMSQTPSISTKSSKLLKNSKMLIVAASAIALATLFNFWNDRYSLSIVVSKRINCHDSGRNNSETDTCSQQQQQKQSSSSFIISSLTAIEASGANALPTLTESTETNYLDGYRFCGKSRVFPLDRHNDDQENSLHLLYQCSGKAYDDFSSSLQKLAANKTSSDTTSWSSSSQVFWGRRQYPLPSNFTVLALGNSHLRQVSKTLACQYSHVLTRIDFLQRPKLLSSKGTRRRYRKSRQLQQQFENRPNKKDQQRTQSHFRKVERLANENFPSGIVVPSQTTSPDAFVLEFENGSRWISITNTVLAYSQIWNELIDRVFLSQVARLKHDPAKNKTQSKPVQIDAVVFGKFTTYEESISTNFYKSMIDEQEAYMRVWDQEAATCNESCAGTNGTTNRTNGTYGFRVSRDYNAYNAATESMNNRRWVDFKNTPPPQLVDIARVYLNQKIIAVSMFSKKDVPSAQSNLEVYKAELERQIKKMPKPHGDTVTSQGSSVLESSNQSDVSSMSRDVHFLNGRKYIEELGIECGSDDKDVVGQCKEPMNITESAEVTADTSTNGDTKRRDRDPSDMHRCAGKSGGHADLISFDVIELMYMK